MNNDPKGTAPKKVSTSGWYQDGEGEFECPGVGRIEIQGKWLLYRDDPTNRILKCYSWVIDYPTGKVRYVDWTSFKRWNNGYPVEHWEKPDPKKHIEELSQLIDGVTIKNLEQGDLFDLPDRQLSTKVSKNGWRQIDGTTFESPSVGRLKFPWNLMIYEDYVTGRVIEFTCIFEGPMGQYSSTVYWDTDDRWKDGSPLTLDEKQKIESIVMEDLNEIIDDISYRSKEP